MPERANLTAYWNEPSVIRATLEFAGAQGDSWDALSDVRPEYLAVAYMQKAFDQQKVSPASSIIPTDLPARIRQEQGWVETFSSQWQRDSKERAGYPAGVIFDIDIDYFGHDKEMTLTDPVRFFRDYVSPVAGVVGRKLERYGIPYLETMTVSGVHLNWFVPATARVFDRLLEIGAVTEPTVLGRQAIVPQQSKRTRPVPEVAQQAFNAVVRLQQFLNTRSMLEARQQVPFPVEPTDLGAYGVALDNTSLLYAVNTRMNRMPAGPYFIKPRWAGVDALVTMLPRKSPGAEATHEDVLNARMDLSQSAEYLESHSCVIPLADRGIDRLITDYKKSGFYRLTQAMDASFGDAPETFDTGYRNYEGIIARAGEADQQRLTMLIRHANPLLLKPNNIQYFVHTIFKLWGGNRENLAVAPHVAGLLRAIYEDSRMGWGKRWSRHYDALRYARGWVMTMLAEYVEDEGMDL